jgi:hypothetical protein
MPAAVREAAAGAGDEIAHRARHQRLARRSHRDDAGRGVNGDATDIVFGQLDLACMQSGAHRDAQRLDGTGDGCRATDGAILKVNVRLGEYARAGVLSDPLMTMDRSIRCMCGWTLTRPKPGVSVGYRPFPGLDRSDVRKALATLREIGGGDFAGQDETKAEAAAMTLRRREDLVTTALGRAVLQCYYRDNRVMCAMGSRAPAALPAGPRGGTGRLVPAGRRARPTRNVSRR